MDIRLDPKRFEEFYSKIALKVRMPPTSSKVLAEFVDIDVSAENVAKILEQNQYFEYFLMQQVKGLGLKDVVPSLKAAIVLRGMQGTRDFVRALQLYRTVTGKHLEKDKDGKISFKASDHLKYALKSEEYIVNRKLQYADSAYAAGMMFDSLVLISRDGFEAPKTFEEYVEQVYKHGLRTARIALELSKVFKNIGPAKFIFAACLIHDLGKVVMELLYPPGSEKSFQKFRDDIDKKPVSREVRHFVETQRFGMPHEFYSAQLAYQFSLFRPVEKAILFHHDPYIIRATNKDVASLAFLIALSSNIAGNYRIPKDANDPVFKAWLSPEIREFKMIDADGLLKAVQAFPKDLV